MHDIDEVGLKRTQRRVTRALKIDARNHNYRINESLVKGRHHLIQPKLLA